MRKLSSVLVRIIDFFYQPFSKIVSEQIFRYAACGSGNIVLDWFLYFIVYNFVIGHNLVYIPLSGLSFLSLPETICITPHIASLCVVFPITLYTGFWLNRHITFRESTLRSYSQLFRYFLVVMLNLAINYFGLKLCVEIWQWYPTPSKMFVTVITVFVSFFCQKYFSFRR